MKRVAQATADVTEAICSLPGVPTLDWCDRAAAALAMIQPGTVAAVAIGNADADGTLRVLEAAGVAADRSGAPAFADALERLRRGLLPGAAFPWLPAHPAPGSVTIVPLKDQGIDRPRFAPLMDRWQTVRPTELIAGAVGLQGAAKDRVLVVEIALTQRTDAPPDAPTSILGATLPRLARRALGAIGMETADPSRWLTRREEEVLRNLLEGKSVPRIAVDLDRSPHTVHDHVKSLHRKLGASNRGELVSRALGHISPAFHERAAGGNTTPGRD